MQGRPISQGDLVLIVGFSLTGLSTIVVGLRFYCRYFLAGRIAAHDYVMAVALLVTWSHIVVNYYQLQFGRSVRFSKSINGAPDSDSESKLAAVSGTLITWWLYRILYSVNLFFVKLSILLFYRIIATTKNFRRAVYFMIAFLSLYSLGMAFASIFQCQNPSDAFSLKVFFGQFSRKFFGKCYQPTLVWFAQAAVNLFTDIILLFLPIPCLLSLWMPLNRRLALVGIFSVGIIAIIASCLRVGVLSIWGKSRGNQSQFGPNLLLWGQVEVNSGIISASIPFLRPLFVRAFSSSKHEDARQRRDKPAGSPRRLFERPMEIETAEFFGGGNVPGKDLESVTTPTTTGNFESDLRMPSEPRGVMTWQSQNGADSSGMLLWKPFITVPESLNAQSSSNRDSVISIQWPLPLATTTTTTSYVNVTPGSQGSGLREPPSP